MTSPRVLLQSQLHGLLERLRVGVFRTTLQGRLLEVNDAFLALLGFDSMEQARRLDLGTLFATASDRLKHARLLRDEKEYAEEVTLRRPDGKRLIVMLTETVSTTLDGEQVVDGLVEDVTHLREAQLQAEAEVQRTLSLLNGTLESTADGILVVDTAGRILRLNQKFAEMWRLPPEIVDSGDDSRAIDFVLDQLEEPEQFLAKVRELYAQPEARSFDILRFRDGRIFERYSQPQQIDGRTVGRVWSFRDVTERSRLEEQLQQAVKMEAVGRLAGGIAHDFNNLLTAILGSAELLMVDLPAGDPHLDDVEEIRDAADRAAMLTRQLLAFSRRQVLQPKVLDLNTVITAVDRLLRRLIGENIALETRLDPQLGKVRADPGQLEQVLVNLAVNARDAMPEGGTIVIETASIEVDERTGSVLQVPPGSYITLTLRDTGTGMSDKVKEHLFEPFFTTKDRGKGTGLGLATVYGIIKQSGGHISVDTALGRGSSFTVLLPRIRSDSVAPLHGRPSQPTPAPISGTILLVEDEPGVRRLTRRVLEGHGFQVLEAATGEEALRLSRQHEGRIDLLVTDVIMPGMNGAELAGQICAGRKSCRVLFISGYTDDSLQRYGVLEPAAGFLQKPFTPNSLMEKVRMVMKSGQSDSTR